jgi:hypothetical protein
MRRNYVFGFAVSFLVASGALAQDPAAQKARAGAPIFMPAAELKWADLDQNAPGIKIVDLWGNHATGPYGALIRFPAGFAAPLHTHPVDAKIVVVSGTFIQGPEGKPEVRLGPGSYMMQPGATYRHTTRCDAASECVIFTESTGAFGLTPAEAPAAK